jgi:hypothetical protein
VVAIALLLPLLLVVLERLSWMAAIHLDGEDRAIVWITGDARELATAIAGAAADPVFAGGGGAIAQPRDNLGSVPHGCPDDAARLHFDIRRTDEAQPARAALESLAAAAGARVCASNLFEINRADGGGMQHLLPMLAGLLLSIGLFVALRLAPATRQRMRLAGIGPAWPPRRVIAMLLGAALLTLALPIRQQDSMSFATSAGATVVLGLMLQPAMHEIAFRGWLAAGLATVASRPVAASLSAAASVLSTLPATPLALLQAVLVAAACALAWCRGATIASCVALHLAVVATLRMLVPL